MNAKQTKNKITQNVITILVGILALSPLLRAADSPSSPASAAPDQLVCNHVRILPRAGFPQLVKGAIIQGSNSGQMDGFTELVTITEDAKEGEWLDVKFANSKVYRFLRYFGPPDSWCNIAELEFYHNDTKLNGASYGTWGTREGKSTFDKAFDHDPKTFFDAAAASDQYAGIEVQGLPSAEPPVVTKGSERKKGARCHYHIGNSLTVLEELYMQAIAQAAGFGDDVGVHWAIPGAPMRMLWPLAIRDEKSPPRVDAVRLAPVDDLVLQCFVSNGDNSEPTPYVGFYDLFKKNSPGVRLWIYGQWQPTHQPDIWEEQVIGLHRIYFETAANAQKMRPLNPPVAVIPGGYALINLKHAIEKGELPGASKDGFYDVVFFDGLHLSELGRCFIGLVHYASIYEKSPVGLPGVKTFDNGFFGKNKDFKPTETGACKPEQIKILEQIAWDSAQSWRAAPEKVIAMAVPGEICGRDYIGSLSHDNTPLTEFWGYSMNGSHSYYVAAPSEGKYLLKVNGMSRSALPKGPDVFLDDEPAGTMELAEKSGKESLIETKAFPLSLKKGLHKLRICQAKETAILLNTLRITKADGSGIPHTAPFCDATIMEMVVEAGATAVKSFKVSDAETPADKLKVTAVSQTPKVLPREAVSVETGADGTCKLSIKHPGQAGTAYLVVTITNNAGLRNWFNFRVICK